MDALLAALRDAAPGLECAADALTTAMYAHDASNYRITPRLVAFPRDVTDVVHVVRTCTAFGVPITARGAGTGIAGNSVGAGVILDFRRHMNHIVEVRVEARSATVQPGAVLDDLQRATAPHGLMFGPDPSSHSRATIGGMLGNDACGNHSVAYGRTSDHVLTLDLVLADGTRATATRHGITAADPRDSARVDELVRALQDIAARHADALASEFERCPRQVSGYAAHRLLPRHGFDVARLLVGSEGSLAIIVGATLALVDVPRDTSLLVIGYRDLIDAAGDVPTLLAHSPAAIEAIDTALVATMRARRGSEAVPQLPAGDAWLFVEFADTVATPQLDEVAGHVQALGRAVSLTPVQDADERRALWRVREDGAGLASNLLDGTRGRPGWEDAAVPPEQLATYLVGLRELSARHRYRGVLYGHFGAGCVHVRFDFDTESEEGRAAMRSFLLEVAALVVRCGGSISGEHGDGRARGELLSVMFSEHAMAAFREVKRAFDPSLLLNPGIIVDAPSLTAAMPTPSPDRAVGFRLTDDGASLTVAAGRCVGIGRCVATGISTMCPTYQVTGLERDGTRGRARGVQDLFVPGGLSTGEALEALDTCLACKACAIDCPTGVDIATYKAEVLHRHYRGRRRPLTHYTLGWLPRLTAIAQRVAPVVNVVSTLGPLRRLLATAAGITAQRPIPRIAPARALRDLRELRPVEPEALLFVDSTTRAFRPQVATAALRVFAAAGVSVETVLDGCCGLTYTSSGQLDLAKRTLQRLLDLVDGHAADIPVVVLEPSCAASLAHDLPQLLDDPRAAALAARIRTFSTALAELAPQWQWPQLPAQVVLQTHCHERAGFPARSQAAELQQHGAAVHETVGCCGMAGAFGYEAQHYDLSIAVAERSLAPTLAENPDAVVLADGFGCACQAEHVQPGRRAQHLAEVLAEALR